MNFTSEDLISLVKSDFPEFYVIPRKEGLLKTKEVVLKRKSNGSEALRAKNPDEMIKKLTNPNLNKDKLYMGLGLNIGGKEKVLKSEGYKDISYAIDYLTSYTEKIYQFKGKNKDYKKIKRIIDELLEDKKKLRKSDTETERNNLDRNRSRISKRKGEKK